MRWFNDARVHKKRNVLDHLPNGMREQVSASLSQAYHSRDFERARRLMMGPALCWMFNKATIAKGAPRHLSSVHNPLFRYLQWRANLRIREI